MNFNKPITSLNDAKNFFRNLEKIEKLFHPDDDPSTIIDQDGKLIFSEIECESIKLRILEIREFFDPCEFIIDEFF